MGRCKANPCCGEYFNCVVPLPQHISGLPHLNKKLPDNPKKAYGDKKPGLHLNPLSAQIAQWEAQFDGALKYGEMNWRDQPVEAMTYIDAAIRHIRLYENGEKYARDTKVQNLGAVMACCAILIDAELHGSLIDNRKHSPATCDLLHDRGEEMVQVLRQAQDDRKNYAPPQQKQELQTRCDLSKCCKDGCCVDALDCAFRNRPIATGWEGYPKQGVSGE